MIIWGWRTRRSTAAKGEFHCPGCSSRQPYNHEKLRRWFTLYFIPAIPLGSVDEQITCGTCRKSWQMSVLANDPDKLKAAQLDRIANDWLSAMAAIAASRGGPTPEVAEMIAADTTAATGLRVTADRVRQSAAGLTAPVPDTTIVARLGSLAADLSSSGQERFINSALNVLRKQTNCGPNEVGLMRSIARNLGVSDSHMNGILMDAGLHDA
jgi:hypothetical protein